MHRAPIKFTNAVLWFATLLTIYLTNRFHFAVRLFSNRSQMTSGTRGDSRVCHWCSYHILTTSVIYLLNRRTATWNLFVLYNKKTTQLQLFIMISKSFSITRKPAFARFGKHEKKPFDVICCLYKMKQSHWLLCRNKELWLVKKNHATVKIDWNNFSLKGLTAKAELNCEIYKC